MTPEFAIYRQLYSTCMAIADTYDYLPDGGTRYPFIYIGNSNDLDQSHSDLMGVTTQSIHVYAKRTERYELEEIKSQLHNAIRELKRAFDYNIGLTNYTTQNLNDNTDVTPLIHAIIDVTFLYSKKGGY